LDDGRLFVAVGDVSGKGIPAALFMAVATTLLRTTAPHGREPDEILQRVNQALFVHNPRGMFVTALCLLLHPATGVVTCGNAGHTTPVLMRTDGAVAPVLGSTGMLVGVLPDVQVNRETLTLAAGESLVLYTDGVTEAFDADGRMFKEDDLLAHL